MKNLETALKGDKIRNVRLRTPLLVSSKLSVQDVLAKMREERRGSAIVVEEKKILGIFTERDALTKLIAKDFNFETSIAEWMTAKPKVLKMDDTVAAAIQLMNQGVYRHIPLVSEADEVEGMIAVKDIVRYLAEHFPYEVYNLPPDPSQVIKAPEGA